MDVRELLRHLQSSSNIAAIGRATGLNRRTVMRYQNWAREQGLLDKPLPPLDQLHHLVATSFHPSPPPQTVSSVAPYADLILALHAQRVDGTAIFQRLQAQGYTGTISSLYRFLHHHNPPSAQPTVRIERDPGTEAQVDFGYAGHLLDPATGQPRKAWAFVMLLAFSRHQYVEFVFDQRLPTWIGLHARAFVFFGGVPHRVVLDNLKAGVTQASFDDPLIQATYRECAEHYGFLLAPCAPRTPQHKGKVEQGGVHYVKRNFLGGREPTTLTQANAEVRRWCLSTAGLRTHGTTKAQPLERFEQIEQACLKPLPPNPYDLATWKKVKLHRDGYVVLNNPTIRNLFASLANIFGFVAALTPCRSTPVTTHWSLPTQEHGQREYGKHIPTTCQHTPYRTPSGTEQPAERWQRKLGQQRANLSSGCSRTRSLTA